MLCSGISLNTDASDQLAQYLAELAVAILLDATIVRSVLVPASMKLLGGWNW